MIEIRGQRPTPVPPDVVVDAADDFSKLDCSTLGAEPVTGEQR